MIILDETEPGSSKLAAAPAPTLRFPDPVAGRSSVQLPSYEETQLQQRLNHSNSSLSTLVSFRKPSFPRRFDSRCGRISFIALAIYVLLTLTIGIPLLVTQLRLRRQARQPPPNYSPLFLDENQAADPLPVVGAPMVMAASTMKCDVWDSQYPLPEGRLFRATARHTLPYDGGVFAIRSNGTEGETPFVFGQHNLTVSLNPDPTERDVVFAVSLTASSFSMLKRAHMCFSPNGPGRGLAVYMPSSLLSSDVQAFDIKLYFPQKPPATLVPGSLIIYLPMFRQIYGDLGDRINFGIINIAGAGLDIMCNHLRANQIAVRSSYASISGSFEATQSLQLDNIQGSILANSTLYNDPTTQIPTYLVMDTGNGDLVAGVTMVSSKPTLAPKFNFNAQTFNGTLFLDVGHDRNTMPAVLQLQAQNNQGHAFVTLDKKYTGAVDLHSKLSQTIFDYSEVKSVAPTGGWRVQLDSNSTSGARGWVGTGLRPKYFDPDRDGKVTVVSALSSIGLWILP
ncbi:Zn(2)-C6 fungal-type domain-containing protein [Favolaschia claudopus]|uniref:Zn(2)-C6 fungal-type domain-containing protein n=1 Tax=Favolaschia claudopus TaxID=2862362 RepID=A0AAW0A983_9AGAR